MRTKRTITEDTPPRPGWAALVFAQARVNGGTYLGDHRGVTRWRWPRNTWLQNRRRELIGLRGDK